MSPVKRFFLQFFAVYVVIGALGLYMWGPPGYSSAYLEQYKEEHDHYIEIIKSQEYKLHTQNPDMHPADEGLRQDLQFAEQYEARPEFQEEQQRQAIFSIYFDLLNGIGLIVLFYRFAWGPLTGFLQSQANAVAQRIREAEEAKSTAREREEQAEAQMEHLGEERRAITENAQELAKREREALEAETESTLSYVANEIEDRKRRDAVLAEHRLKAELVDSAINKFIEQYQAHMKGAGEMDRRSVDLFLQELEKQAASTLAGGRAS